MEKQKPEVEEVRDSLRIRELVIAGLALAVPEFLSRAQAAERVQEWFPTDELAVRSLHKQISANLQPIAA